MRTMLGTMVPWVRHRRTYGSALAERELVRRRLARLASLIVGCDALVQWASGLLDDGLRGELECATTKIFGSESLKEAASDNLYDYLTPCVYEGEGEILSLAVFRGLSKPPREPLRDVPAAAGDWIADEFHAASVEFTEFTQRHGAAALERQSEAVELSQRVQRLTVASVVRQFQQRSEVEIERLAAEVLLDALEREVRPRRRSAAESTRADRLGQWLADGGFRHWLEEPLPPESWLVRDG
jgi:hypothetical protein